MSSNVDQPLAPTYEDGATPPERPKLGILVVSMPLLSVKDIAMNWRAPLVHMQLQGLLQVEETTHDFDWMVLHGVADLNLQGENPRCDPSLLYMAMAAFCASLPW